jgi:hypothetical protein
VEWEGLMKCPRSVSRITLKVCVWVCGCVGVGMWVCVSVCFCVWVFGCVGGCGTGVCGVVVATAAPGV